MESFDIKYNGRDGVLYIDGRTLTMEVGDSVLFSSHVLSASMVGTERIRLVWDDDSGKRVGVLIRILSAPADSVLTKIVNPPKS